jgi:hypothetical protein
LNLSTKGFFSYDHVPIELSQEGERRPKLILTSSSIPTIGDQTLGRIVPNEDGPMFQKDVSN